MCAHHQRRSLTLLATQSSVRSSSTKEKDTSARLVLGSSLNVSVCCPSKILLSWNSCKNKRQTKLKQKPCKQMILGLQRTSTLPWNPFLPFQHKKRLSSDRYSCNRSRCSNQRDACGAHLSQLRHAVTPIFQDRRIRRLCFIKRGVIFRIKH